MSIATTIDHDVIFVWIIKIHPQIWRQSLWTIPKRQSEGFYCCCIKSEASPQIHHKVRLIKISLAPGGVFVFGFDHTGFCCLKHLVFGTPKSSGLRTTRIKSMYIVAGTKKPCYAFQNVGSLKPNKKTVQEFHKLGTCLYTLHSIRTDGLMQSYRCCC